MGMNGLTEGTRHYVQFDLTGDGWTDLIHIDSEGWPHGLWCSHRITTAEARIQELMAECSTQRDQYRIVKRTFAFEEKVVEFDPNYGKAFNDPSHDYSQDDDETDEDADESYDGQNEDATMEVNLEAQVGEVPDTGTNPLIK
jgi:hypothetical protein